MPRPARWAGRRRRGPPREAATSPRTSIGNLGLKQQLGLVDADIDQAGQTGGQLLIPGIHGYGTPR
ncbi:hypothetical protein [Streptomyces canus]|uniref:hypothetical protein n=1 Tax=Streptomyces canus TaxID=58343 RepID=UPI002E2FC9AC|nr:hypothetical protein [Streptomyces canus]